MEREEYYKAIGLSDVAQKRAENIVCTLTSFGTSCQYVEDIVKKYFIPIDELESRLKKLESKPDTCLDSVSSSHFVNEVLNDKKYNDMNDKKLQALAYSLGQIERLKEHTDKIYIAAKMPTSTGFSLYDGLPSFNSDIALPIEEDFAKMFLKEYKNYIEKQIRAIVQGDK